MCGFHKFVENGGNICINLKSYKNPTHRLSSGRCCEQGLEKACKGLSRCENCTMECDNLFFINMTHTSSDGNITAYETIRTNVIAYTDNIRKFPRNLTNKIPNPVSYRFEKYWGNFTLKVTAFDEDSPTEIDKVDSVIHTINTTTITPREYSRINPFETTLRGKVSELTVAIWAVCKINYYGADCAKHCVGRNNINGHYGCNTSTGDIVCLKGWTNITTKCTRKDIFLTLSMNGNFQQISARNFSNVLHGIILQEINTRCLQHDNKQQRRRAGIANDTVVEFKNENFTKTHAYVEVRVNIDGKIQRENISSCLQNAIYESSLLRKRLQISTVSACVDSAPCKTGITRGDNKTKKRKKYITLIIGISAAVVVLLFSIFIVRMQKKSKKIDVTTNEKSVAMTTNNNNAVLSLGSADDKKEEKVEVITG